MSAFIGWTLLAISGLIFLWEILVRTPEDVELVRANIVLPELPGELEGRKILFFSDLHHRPEPGFRESWVKACLDKLEYDLLILGGDLIECSEGAYHFFQMLEGIRPKLGAYVVHGNNEARHADCRALKAKYQDLGVAVLDNLGIEIASSRETFQILGVNDASIEEDDLDKALSSVSDSSFRILISHSPEVFPEAKEKGIQLVFSGHTHGGQVRFPWIGALWTDTPRTGLKYQHGIYPEESSLLVLSKGIGTSKLPIRWLAKPEVYLLTLQRSKDGLAKVDSISRQKQISPL